MLTIGRNQFFALLNKLALHLFYVPHLEFNGAIEETYDPNIREPLNYSCCLKIWRYLTAFKHSSSFPPLALSQTDNLQSLQIVVGFSYYSTGKLKRYLAGLNERIRFKKPRWVGSILNGFSWRKQKDTVGSWKSEIMRNLILE